MLNLEKEYRRGKWVVGGFKKETKRIDHFDCLHHFAFKSQGRKPFFPLIVSYFFGKKDFLDENTLGFGGEFREESGFSFWTKWAQ